MQLSAQQRYATLQIMGTRLWVPRVNLQGAAPSKICDWPLPAKPISARERLLQQQVKAAPLVQQSAAVVPVSAPQAQVPKAQAQQQPLTQPPQQQQGQGIQANQAVHSLQVTHSLQSSQPLQATIWLLANGWQLVMEIPNGAAGLQEVDVKLLHNLLVALYPGGLGIVAQQNFNWPMLGVPVAAGDEGELSMTLQAFLTGARVQGIQLAGCLVFGERLFKLMENNANMPRLFASPKLIDLQQQPLAKQNFWQQAGNSGLRAAFASSPVVL